MQNIIDEEVNILIQLKNTFKSVTKTEWKVGLTIDQLKGTKVQEKSTTKEPASKSQLNISG